MSKRYTTEWSGGFYFAFDNQEQRSIEKPSEIIALLEQRDDLLAAVPQLIEALTYTSATLMHRRKASLCRSAR